MKTLFFIFSLVICLCTSGFAQTETGTLLLGGTGTLHINKDKEMGTASFLSLSPRIGYFFEDNVALGVVVPVFYANTFYSVLGAGISPFVRGYLGSSSTKLFAEAKAGYNYQRVDMSNSSYYYDDNSGGFFSYGVGVGVVHFLNEYVGLEAILTYDDSTTEGRNAISGNNLNGINLNIGFQIHLPKKQ